MQYRDRKYLQQCRVSAGRGASSTARERARSHQRPVAQGRRKVSTRPSPDPEPSVAGRRGILSLKRARTAPGRRRSPTTGPRDECRPVHRPRTRRLRPLSGRPRCRHARCPAAHRPLSTTLQDGVPVLPSKPSAMSAFLRTEFTRCGCTWGGEIEAGRRSFHSSGIPGTSFRSRVAPCTAISCAACWR